MPLEKKESIPIGYYAILEKNVIGLLKIREMKRALDFFEDAYKFTQGKGYDRDLAIEIRDLREELEFKEEGHLDRLEKLVKPKNLSFFQH
jgi:hypothetical protein